MGKSLYGFNIGKSSIQSFIGKTNRYGQKRTFQHNRVSLEDLGSYPMSSWACEILSRIEIRFRSKV